MANACQSETSANGISEDLRFPLLERFIPSATVKTLLEQYGVASKRENKLPAPFVVYFVIALCLYSHKSMRETQRTLLDNIPIIAGLPRKDKIASRSAFTQARRRLGAKIMAELYEQIVKPLATSNTPGAFFHKLRVVVIDGSTLAFIDTQQSLAEFGGPSKTKGASSFPMGNLVVLVECGTHIIFGVALAPYASGETVVARNLLHKLRPGMICVLDRNYIGYPWLKEAMQTGAAFLIRIRRNMELPVLKVLKDGSYISNVPPPYAARKAGARSIKVRVIEYKIDGKPEVYRLITTLLDAKKVPAQELAQLYLERWEVEITLCEMKSYLRGGSLETFRR